jgi:hypothetical protein
VQRLIARLLLLVAVLLMPLGMSAVPAAPHAMSSPSARTHHCPDQQSSHHGKTGVAECTMVCSSALPADDSSSEDMPMAISAPHAAALAQALRGILPETSTPPPKLS